MVKLLKIIAITLALLILVYISPNLSFSTNTQNVHLDKRSTTSEESKIYKDQRQKSATDIDQREYLPQKTYDNFDETVKILGIVVNFLGIFITILAVLITLLVALGFIERKKIEKLKEEFDIETENCKAKVQKIEQDAQFIEGIRKKVEEQHDYIDHLMKDAKKSTTKEISTEKITPEEKSKLDEISKRVEFLELFGESLKPDYFIALGNNYFADKKFAEAIKSYDKAIAKNENDFVAWSNKSAALVKLKRYDEALGVSEKAIELKSDYAEAWNNKTSALINLDRYDEALGASKKAIELKPDHAMAWCNKGIALGKLKRYEESLQAFEKARELKPGYAGAWYNEACLCSIAGNKKDALSNLEKAIKFDISYKETAKADADFKPLWNDEDFKHITG